MILAEFLWDLLCISSVFEFTSSRTCLVDESKASPPLRLKFWRWSKSKLRRDSKLLLITYNVIWEHLSVYLET